ncbi:MAG: DUF349 domain-containing protein [Gammaproteobacteria bacterium]|nr:DUF349 domain-containing protein [Gammaproteobacteria bacterium]MDP2140417.1 DUF349 domain-containing protein [Gammaproteobacteria bacterium]MDP2349456.1 DUF349 domain-containing protein [Gammaproteobacteria bacterium]
MIFQKFLQNNKWQHKDPAVRLEAIGELSQSTDPADPDAGAVAQIIIDIARTDSDQSVRLAAIALLHAAEVLQELSGDANIDIQHAARVQYCRVVAGAAASDLSPTQRLALMQAMTDVADLLAVLHDCGCDETGLATLDRLRNEHMVDESGLVNIAAHSSNHTVRNAAALAISDTLLLEKLATLVRQKDKNVYKYCKEILQQRLDIAAKLEADVALAVEICTALESLAGKVIGGLSQAQFEYKLSQWQDVSSVADDALQQRFQTACDALSARIAEHHSEQQQAALQQQNFESLAAACNSATETLTTLQEPLSSEQITTLEQQIHALKGLFTQRSNQEPEELLTQCKTLIQSGDAAINAFHALEAKAPDLDALRTEIGALTAKNTIGINNAAKRLQKLFNKDGWPAHVPHSTLFLASVEIAQQMQRLQDKNKAYLEKLHKDSLANIAALEQHVEQGQVNEAQRLWDKVQGAIKNADDALKKELQEKVAPFKARINELMDWKNFAATEKKKELIGHMQALIDGKMHAADKAKRIKTLQEEWKKLGHSLHNDSLWTQFNELSHTAFEPCKEYFKERKAKLHTNLEERMKICAQLEELLATLTPETLNIANLNKIENKALEDWKIYAPVEQSKIKKLQKRFNTVLTAVRQFKRKTLQANATQKLELIAQAEQLDTLENVKEAMVEAKRLQALWKTIGPSPYKDDRNHWNSFRAACDKIFTKRQTEPAPRKTDSSARPSRPVANPAVAAARDALRRISDLLTLSSEELAQSKKQFAELREAFMNTLTPDLKLEKKALLEQFEKLSKNFDAKLRAAPDKKSLQLIGQVKTKAEFCEKLEAEVLSGKSMTDDIDTLTEQWQALGKLADMMQEQTLEQRFHNLSQGADARLLKKQSKDNEEKAREVCIAAEIHAGIESPDADKPLRMQVQLKQLKNSFGKTSKSGAQLVSELEMQLMCLGPIEGKARKGFEARITKAKEKL